MEKEIYSEMIEAFLLGQLAESEAIEIRNKMKSNKEFRRLVRLHEFAIAGIQDAASAKSKNQPVKEILKTAEPTDWSPPKIRFWENFAFLRRASIGLAAAVFLVFLVFRTPFDANETLDSFMNEHTVYDLSVMGGQGIDDSQELLEKAFDAYNDKQFAAAADYFQAYIQKKPNDMAAKLHHAISLRHIGKPKEAITILTEIKDNYTGLAPTWQLALSYVEDQDYTSSLKIIEEIRATELPKEWRQRTKNLRKAIKKIQQKD